MLIVNAREMRLRLDRDHLDACNEDKDRGVDRAAAYYQPRAAAAQNQQNSDAPYVSSV